MNASGSLHIGPVPSVSLGGSSGTSDYAWVGEQTGLYSKGAITLHAKGAMTVAGAVIASESHQGSITAKTLTVTDILDHDTASSVSGAASGSLISCFLPMKGQPEAVGTPLRSQEIPVLGCFQGRDVERAVCATRVSHSGGLKSLVLPEFFVHQSLREGMVPRRGLDYIN